MDMKRVLPQSQSNADALAKLIKAVDNQGPDEAFLDLVEEYISKKLNIGT